MHARILIAAAIAAVLAGGSAAVPGPAAGYRAHASTASAARSSRPNRADWEKIKTAAGLRSMALAPHRTAHFRAFAASLGLSELVSVHPLAPGRCRTAVIDLHNNLLDLENAYPGENWNPLRRAVAREPSINTCAPRPSTQHDA
jgi:hypothetical protein